MCIAFCCFIQMLRYDTVPRLTGGGGGGLPIYDIVRMCVPNSPLAQAAQLGSDFMDWFLYPTLREFRVPD